VESEDENISDDDEIKTADLNPDDEINAVTARKFPKRLFATINVAKTPVRFQLDGGASCNVISAKTLENCLVQVELKKTTKTLSMHNAPRCNRWDSVSWTSAIPKPTQPIKQNSQS